MKPYVLREEGVYTNDSVLGLATTYFRQPMTHPRRLPPIPMSSMKSSRCMTKYAAQKEARTAMKTRTAGNGVIKAEDHIAGSGAILTTNGGAELVARLHLIRWVDTLNVSVILIC